MKTTASLAALVAMGLCIAAMFHVSGATVRNAAQGRYYVNSADARADDSGPGTQSRPWKSLAAVNAHSFRPGDTVCFANGSVYAGGFTIKDSGTAAQPIVLTACGKGPAPRFSNPDFGVLDGNVVRIEGSHVVVDGLHFREGAAAPPSDDEGSIFRMGAVFVEKGADHAVIRNSEVVDYPIGFNVHAEHALITQNDLHDCTRFIKPPYWGPIAIFIGNSNAEISHNRIRNYAVVGGKYGADGGAIEIDSRLHGVAVNDVSIHHNDSYGNEGFLEIEAKYPTDRLKVSYNVSNDYQNFIFFWSGTNALVENNTVLRVLPKNSVTDVVFSFKHSGNAIRNNIFVVGEGRQAFTNNGTQVYSKGNYAGQKRYNNLYFSVDGTREDPVGLPLGEGEKVVDPGFVDYAKGDYRLRPGSPAIDAGFGSGRDIGAFEFAGK